MASGMNIVAARNSSGDPYLSSTFAASPGTSDQVFASPASGCLFYSLAGVDTKRYRGVEIQLISNGANNATMAGIECGLVYRNANSGSTYYGAPFTTCQYTPIFTAVTATIGTAAVIAATVSNLGLTGSYTYCDTLAGSVSAYASTRLDGESGLTSTMYSPVDNTRAAIVIPYTADADGVYVYGGGDLSSTKVLAALVRPYGGAF